MLGKKVKFVLLQKHHAIVICYYITCLPKSVRNRSVIDLFVALFVLSFCPFDISVGVGAFVIGLSQISSFFSSLINRTIQIWVNVSNFTTLLV